MDSKKLLDAFLRTRAHTETICRPLEIEDYVVQPVDYVSPPKWHLGHTSWFFEEFVLKKFKPGYREFNEGYAYVFNSYYENVGKRVFRPSRGNLSRPSVSEIYDYREYVTKEIQYLLRPRILEKIARVLLVGIHHEQQHQELLLTDIKYILGSNPSFPEYKSVFDENTRESSKQDWVEIPEGTYEIGYDGKGDFCYDNELMRHKKYISSCMLSNKLVTNGEYLEFIEADGYKDFNLWHSEGLDWKEQYKISKPLYWHKIDGVWYQYTLNGLEKLNLHAPVSHVSYYEAYAYAAWKGCRLPTEFEWEVAESRFKWGSRWEWTESSYLPYPHFKKAPGALGEYNGKFMVNQKVLRGKSVATSPNHSRASYRNFFPPHLRWQFTGIRLAK